jgi:outer membrane protein assembly factor BamB
VQSGDLLAVTTEQDGSFNFWVINSNGEIVFPASSPAPISAHRSPTGGFLISVSSQIGYLGMDMLLRPLMDTGRGLARGTQAVQTPQGEVIVYPGYGSELFAYNADGTLRWTANLYSNLPGAPFAPPLLATGLGCAVYVLTFDGTLSAIRMADGTTGGSVGLYAGGINNTPAGRAVEVLPGEQVRFSAGYLSVATIDGSTLAGC